jgi:hypothetical protein
VWSISTCSASVGDFPVEADRLDGTVGAQHDRAARSFVAAARLHADIAVLDQIETADAVLATQFVELGQNLGRAHAGAVQGDDIAFLVGQFQILGLVGRGFRRHRPPPHRLFGLGIGVFQMAAFVGNVQQVGVHRIR